MQHIEVKSEHCLSVSLILRSLKKKLSIFRVRETELHIFVHLLNVSTTSNRSQQYAQSTFRQCELTEAGTEKTFTRRVSDWLDILEKLLDAFPYGLYLNKLNPIIKKFSLLL